MKLSKKWIFSGLAALAFLGLSVTIYEVNTYRIDRPTELRFDFSGIKPVEAGESAWGGVRQSVTWANNNGALIDSVLTALNNVGFFAWPDGTVLKRVNVQMGTFLGKIQLDRGASSRSSRFRPGSAAKVCVRGSLLSGTAVAQDPISLCGIISAANGTADKTYFTLSI